MQSITRCYCTVLFCLVLTLCDMIAGEARAADAIQSQETSVSGIVADLVECRRAEGMLTIKLRMRNTGADKVSFVPVPSNADSYYVTAESKKYFVLRDSERAPLMSSDAMPGSPVGIARGGAWFFWARYPAPPPQVKKISYYTALTGPFDNVPVSGD